jgi:hypothetical protein
MDPIGKMTDKAFERHALAILKRELGLDGFARFLCFYRSGPATTPETAIAGWKAPQSRKSWPKWSAATRPPRNFRIGVARRARCNHRDPGVP